MIYDILRCERIMDEVWREVDVKGFKENVASMGTSDLTKLTALLGTQPYLICSSRFGWARRERFFFPENIASVNGLDVFLSPTEH